MKLLSLEIEQRFLKRISFVLIYARFRKWRRELHYRYLGIFLKTIAVSGYEPPKSHYGRQSADRDTCVYLAEYHRI